MPVSHFRDDDAALHRDPTTGYSSYPSLPELKHLANTYLKREDHTLRLTPIIVSSILHSTTIQRQCQRPQTHGSLLWPSLAQGKYVYSLLRDFCCSCICDSCSGIILALKLKAIGFHNFTVSAARRTMETSETHTACPPHRYLREIQMSVEHG